MLSPLFWGNSVRPAGKPIEGDAMANLEHLRILKQGVKAWNQWRKEHIDIQPDLEEADLRGTDLRGINLRGANLGGANLCRADIRGAYIGETNGVADLRVADLREADLSRANLSETNLSGAKLSGANLCKADLSRANLRGADLFRANLSRTNLRKADLRKACLSEANLTDTVLSETRMPSAYLRNLRARGRFSTRTADDRTVSLVEVEEVEVERGVSAAGGLSNPPAEQVQALLVQSETTPQAESAQEMGITEPVNVSATSEALRLVMQTIPESVIMLSSLQDEYLEGSPKERLSKSYERDPRVRTAAIAIHGTKCVVCGFDFADVYGERGAGYIEVHHLRPISGLQGETKIDPKTDMTVLCSNCHAMIHRSQDNVLTPNELSTMIQRSRFDNSGKQV